MGEEKAMDLGYAGLLTDEKEWLRLKKKNWIMLSWKKRLRCKYSLFTISHLCL